MDDLSALAWIVLALAAFTIGLSKSGLPGAGQLAILLAVSVLPAKASTGLILPMLLVGDLLAVWNYRRDALWPHLLRLLPCSAAGIVLGFLALGRVSDQQLRPIIGAIILAMLIANYIRARLADNEDSVPRSWAFAAALGLVAGLTTMMANSGGPIVVLYLLAMRLPKQNFIGTAAWYFLIVNAVKIPFSANLHLITPHSLALNALFVPLIVAGSFAGVRLTRVIPQKAFDRVMELLILAGAIQLFF